MLKAIAIVINQETVKELTHDSDLVQKSLPVLLILFWLISIAGSPYRYEYSKGARYILPVLRTADPELFTDDPIVDAYSLFESAFYQALGLGFAAAHVPAEQVQPFMYVLYILSRLAIVLGLFALARALSSDIWLFILIAAWGAFQKSAFIGSTTLFLPDLTHETVAFIMGLFALYFLIKGKELGFWILVALGLFVHSLIALHLALIVAPVLILHRRINRWNIMGGAFFALGLILYVLFMTPPPMSVEESNLFLLMKGDMGHISPFAQAPLNWVRFAALVVLSLLAHFHITRGNAKHRLIANLIIAGIVIGLALAGLATLTQWLRLVQLQPMRIFYWVSFLAYLLLILATFESLKTENSLRFLLFGLLVFVIIDSLWAVPLFLFGIAYLLAATYLYRANSNALPKLELAATIGFSLFCVTVVIAWLINAVLVLDFNSFTLHSAIAAIALLLLIHLTHYKPEINRAMLGVTLLCALVIGSVWWQSYYADRKADEDWIAVQEWSRENTNKSDQFITPPDAGDFHVRSLRSSFTDGSSAVVWVAPSIYEEMIERQAAFNRGREDQGWNLVYLSNLAKQWNVEYIIVSGAYSASGREPIYQSGQYSIFDVQH